MHWPKIVLLTWLALTVLSTITNIGKERKPVDPPLAGGVLILSGILAWLVVIA